MQINKKDMLQIIHKIIRNLLLNFQTVSMDI